MARVKANFQALKHQVEFAQLKDKNCAIVGGYGSGKSQAVVFRSLQMLKDRKKAIICIIAPTYSLLEDVNIIDFEEIFNHYKIRYDHRRKERKFIVNSGGLQGEIWFRTGDRPEKIVGFDATDVIIDEFDVLSPSKQADLWRRAIARIRREAGATIAVATTPEGFRMTYDLFEKKKIGPLVRAKTTDNGFLPPDYVEELRRQYDPLLVRQYLEAEFVNINGLAAYYGFSREKNHRKTLIGEVDAHPAIGVGWDFNVAKMCCEVFTHDAVNRRIHFFDEIIVKGAYGNLSPTQRACDIIRDRYPKHIIRVYPDSTGRRRQTNAAISDIEIIRSNGFQVYAKSVNPFVRDRLSAVNAKLTGSSITVDVDKCPDLVEDFERCERDEYGDLDKSQGGLTHSSDAAGYAIAYLYPVMSSRIGTIRRAS
jgi:hypothetical protein